MKLYSSDLQVMDEAKGPEFSVEKLRVVFMHF